MRVVRWTIGLIIFAAFFYFNFFIYDGELLFKLINVILFSSLLILLRVMFGPTAADRVVAVDILGVLIFGMLALIGLFYNQSFFMDIGLIWALLSFIATLAFSKILEGRRLDD
ncbi:MAG TPA: monovalent cation/H+ antiporter complex subunit F [Ignavibacteriaceae bacterium]|nr:monovalent cation/H+ antiporter complex subunit F [Ignavibacteriaceae bacterium]